MKFHLLLAYITATTTSAAEVASSSCVRLGPCTLNAQSSLSSAFNSYINQLPEPPSHLSGRVVALPTSLSAEEKQGIMQSLLDSDDFVDMDADDDEGPSASFVTPSVFASSTSSSVSVVSSPSDALETIGVANLSPHDLVYVVDLTGAEPSHPPSSVTIAALENLAKSSSPTTLTIVTIGSNSSEDTNLNTQDKILYHIESLLSSTTTLADRLTDIFSSTTFTTSTSTLSTPPSTTSLSGYITSLKQSSSSSYNYFKSIAQSIKITSKPDPEEEDEDFDATTLNNSMDASSKLQAAALTVTQTLNSKLNDLTDAAGESAIRTFGDDVTSLYRDLIESFEDAAESAKANNLPNADIARIRRATIAELKRILSKSYVLQVSALADEEFQLFKQSLSSLKINSQLEANLSEAVKTSTKSFATALALMSPSISAICPDSYHASGATRTFKASLKEFMESRLVAARASGSYTPVPRKPVSFGLHWLLPKPFGDTAGDFRQSEKQDPNNLIYTPKTKRSEVDKNDVAQGRDWRSKVSSPSADSSIVFNP